MLLSFAQFEREVTAERIRDKLAASAKRGLWMGGLAPLGYDPHADPNKRELVLNKVEAVRVERIFQLYDQHQCLGEVSRLAEREGIRSKTRCFASGTQLGDKVMSRGAIHSILTNPVYRGMVRHKESAYPANHSAIIDEDLWSRVQESLKEKSARQRGQRSKKTGNGSPLTGKLFDENGDRLTPTYANSKGRRWRYYVSRSLMAQKSEGSDGWRLPAAKLEKAVAEAFNNWATSAPDKLLRNPSANSHSKVSAALGQHEPPSSSTWKHCFGFIDRIEVRAGELELKMDAKALLEIIGIDDSELSVEALVHTEEFVMKRRGVETVLILGAAKPGRDPTLINAIAKAHVWMKAWREGSSLSDIAKSIGWTPSPLRQRLKLAFLSPAIIKAILDGRQPADLSLERILRSDLPLDWDRQAKTFGFELP